MVPLQPSRSLDLGALPTWRNKTFISLHNYWTGEQQSDRLHMQAKAVRVSSPLPPFPSTFLSLNSPFLICLSLPFPPLSLPSLPFPPSFPYFVVFIITCLTCHTLCYMVQSYAIIQLMTQIILIYVCLIQAKMTGCHPSHCVGSQIWPKEHPRSRPYGPPRQKEEMKELAKDYIKTYYDSLKL